ncbi:hypothetical protein SUGI_0676480 [Cryptomeria japonica]|nr:hypothetical protein SUGI_0676380 [Cryptomeria japonica]GLJ33651.1 hypothetical protein SUGI_0676430 [Cryptomeria japonica]GLJ33655.1 hypothetical protein SUGI_0676480 [Cryptomeria japonica]
MCSSFSQLYTTNTRSAPLHFTIPFQVISKFLPQAYFAHMASSSSSSKGKKKFSQCICLEWKHASSSPHRESEHRRVFSGIEPHGMRRKVSESSRLFDVLINHRGPDVKNTLALQLYTSLEKLRIRAFLDSEEKELGDSFPSTIETAIRSAVVHIAIFSKGYAESAWCLGRARSYVAE